MRHSSLRRPTSRRARRAPSSSPSAGSRAGCPQDGKGETGGRKKIVLSPPRSGKSPKALFPPLPCPLPGGQIGLSCGLARAKGPGGVRHGRHGVGRRGRGPTVGVRYPRRRLHIGRDLPLGPEKPLLHFSSPGKPDAPRAFCHERRGGNPGGSHGFPR